MKFASKMKQAGMTLIEMSVALVISGLVIGGALALYNNASSTQYSNQLSSDLAAMSSATKALYFGQGGYGATSLNTVLINAKKIPDTMVINGSTITHQLNGSVVVAGNAAEFTMTVTNIPTDVCVGIVTMAKGYRQIQVGSNAAVTTFPISPAVASTQCATASQQTIVYTAS